MSDVLGQIDEANRWIGLTRKIGISTYVGVVALGLAFIAGGSDMLDLDEYWAGAMGSVGVGLITAAVIGLLLGPIDRAIQQADRAAITVALMEQTE